MLKRSATTVIKTLPLKESERLTVSLTLVIELRSAVGHRGLFLMTKNLLVVSLFLSVVTYG